MIVKFCPDCLAFLHIDLFWRNAAQADGFNAQCISCSNLRRLTRHGFDPEQIFQYCRDCGDLKPLCDFDRHALRQIGYVDRCKVCRRLARLERAAVEHNLLAADDPIFPDAPSRAEAEQTANHIAAQYAAQDVGN